MAEKSEKTKQNLTYEQGMKRLEEIVAKLEGGSLSLDESLKLFEEGTGLVSFLNGCLDSAQQKITELTAFHN